MGTGVRHFVATFFALSLVFIVLLASAQDKKAQKTVYRLDSTDGLELINTNAQIVNYRGRRALHLAPPPGIQPDKAWMIALVSGTDFKDGTIEAEVAGVPIAAMDPTARGFVGVEFRAQQNGAKAENIYIRPTNGRADDQLRRNHSVQYESFPDFQWDRLRREQPGVYESYVDLEAGAWTKMKIEVTGSRARLYVNAAQQPCLIVNDLKMGDVRGQIGLWAFISTDAYFSSLTVAKTN